MTPELYLAIAMIIAGTLLTAFSTYRRRNLTMAVCVECKHTSAKLPVSRTVAAAKHHREVTGHQCMMVKV